MKIGVCTGTDKLALLAELGYDYFEPNFSWLASLDEATYREQTALVEKHGLPAESYNIFFRGGMKLYAKDGGQDELLKEIEAFATHGFARASAWGGKLAVIGSGFARGIPADMTREEIEPQFARVLAVCGEAADRYGMRVAVEPLCSQECNYLHTVGEGAHVATLSGSVAVGTIVDFSTCGGRATTWTVCRITPTDSGTPTTRARRIARLPRAPILGTCAPAPRS